MKVKAPEQYFLQNSLQHKSESCGILANCRLRNLFYTEFLATKECFKLKKGCQNLISFYVNFCHYPISSFYQHLFVPPSLTYDKEGFLRCRLSRKLCEFSSKVVILQNCFCFFLRNRAQKFMPFLEFLP